MCDERRERIIEWLANGQTGLSSQAVAFAALGVVKSYHGEVPYPHDPDDLLRCIRLEEAVPRILDDAGPLLAQHSTVWPELIHEWGYLTALLRSEAPEGRGHAPITYRTMRKLIDAGRRSATAAAAHGEQSAEHDGA